MNLFVKVAKATHGHVGIDLNTDNFLTDSGGNIVPNPRYYRTIKGKLAKEQRILSRRQQRAKKNIVLYAIVKLPKATLASCQTSCQSNEPKT